jgi:hypothetical protein
VDHFLERERTFDWIGLWMGGISVSWFGLVFHTLRDSWMVLVTNSGEALGNGDRGVLFRPRREIDMRRPLFVHLCCANASHTPRGGMRSC